jgi:hypothetical protein
MAAIQDVGNIFVGDTLDVFNLMESLVLRDGDAAGAQQALLPVMLEIISHKQSAPDPNNPGASTDSPRG